MSDDRAAAHRTMETALVVFKDPRLELHHPVPSQPKEIVAMRHLARYEESSAPTSTTPATPAPPRRAPDHGEPPAAGYFAADFSWRAEFGARPDWCPGQDPEPEREPEPETSPAPRPLTPDPDLFDGLYGVAEHPKRIDSAAYVSQGGQQHQHQQHQQPQEHERSQAYAYAYAGQGHGASQTYAYAGQGHGASQSRPHHHYEYRPSYSDGDYECSFFSRRSAAPPAAASATASSTATHQQHQQHQQHHARRHQPSNSLVLRNVHGQDRLSPFEWRVFNETRIHEDE